MMQTPDYLLVFGANSAIAKAMIQQVNQTYPDCKIIAISRNTCDSFAQYPNIITQTVDYQDEQTIKDIVDQWMKEKAVYWIICSIGMLHDQQQMPEKSISNIDARFMEKVFYVNTIIPSLILKYVLPKLPKQLPSLVACFSARVGSISDNQLGGWYSYRASKAALNMIIKSSAIEMHRFHPQNIIVGLHPGTVDSNLSKPFQKNVPADRLFTADYSAEQLLKVLLALSPSNTGTCLAWDGQLIDP